MALKNVYVTPKLPTYFSIGRKIRTYYKRVAPNKCCGTFFVHWFGQVHQSITASKENVVVFFQFEYAEFSGYVHFFRFRPQIPFLGKFGPKNQNCQVILKFGTWTNSNMPNSVALFNFSPFYWNYPFWSNLFQPWCHAVLVFFVTLLQSHVYMYLYINRIYISLCFNSCI